MSKAQDNAADFIRWLLLQGKMTKKEVAEAAGVSVRQLDYALNENNKRKLGFHSIERLAESLDLDLAEITQFSGENEMWVDLTPKSEQEIANDIPAFGPIPASSHGGSTPMSVIGRELAEIRLQLESVGLPEEDIQAELRAWLRSRRAEPPKVTYGEVREPYGPSQVQEEKKEYPDQDTLNS